MEWAARGLPMAILPCQLGCPLLPYYGNNWQLSGQRSGLPIGCPWEFAMQIRLPTIYGNSWRLSWQPTTSKYDKWTTQWALESTAHWLPMGILPCKLGCPLLQYMETVNSSVGSGLDCLLEFVMQIRLSTTSIYGYNGQLSRQISGQPTTFKYGISVQLSGQPTELPTIECTTETICDSHARHL